MKHCSRQRCLHTSLLGSSVVNEPGLLNPRDGFDATGWPSLRREPAADVNHEGSNNSNQEQPHARAGAAVQDTALLRSAVGIGAGRDRTGDLRLAKAALSQLSYSPDARRRAAAQPRGLVGLSGFEPLTSRLSAVRSSQLSYRPVVPPRPTPLVDTCFSRATAAPRGGRGGSLKTRQAQNGSSAGFGPVDSLERR